MNEKVSLSRRLAYDALERIRRDGSFANDVIDKIVDPSDASAEDKAFATRLVLGVVATSGSLDAIINRFLDKGGVKGKLKTALRIATYELVYLEKDAYAPVDQCVELVKSVQPRAVGLANAVLRKISGSIEDFPYGDPSIDIDSYSLKHAFPNWLVELVVSDLGDRDGDEFICACNSPSPIYIHLNALSDAEHVLEKFGDNGISFEEVDIDGIQVANCLKLSSSTNVASTSFLECVEKGQILVSDASAQLISQLACKAALRRSANGDISCLELCAGRGTKTILLQSNLFRLSGQRFSKFVVVDNIDFKLRLSFERSKAYGASIDRCICADATDLGPHIGQEKFDLVFLDAPCSGLGTMRRHPEIRWRVRPDVIEENGMLDLALLKEAARYVRHGGVIAYSTCTITKEENERVVDSFLSTEYGAEFKMIPIEEKPYLRTKLHMGEYDSHFCALLARKGLR